MITDEFQLRPRYGEVDQMRYVYHGNYLSYCHQARNELLRKLGLDEIRLEHNHIILPVISFNIKYKKPAHFDELITIKTIIKEMPKTRFNFEFEIKNEQNTLLSKAKSTVLFVDSESRVPKRIPEFIKEILNLNFEALTHETNSTY
ncbi:acyl-CoA thioesterase [Winogradskyella endarachnes]|uniref:YbgC/FadM family acyl-CoA thioesterase n=1 Tax=Winogradskyella endarachnes TaxID=2681965 RepID=A0A6L6U8F2_9FLAO|nr:thioesterase family protein [Winogradskyella endarachnes]MUU78448.1 YbgC/FadM family acyl-CoA thioesterase [Winogradskyella endarachnes]